LPSGVVCLCEFLAYPYTTGAAVSPGRRGTLSLAGGRTQIMATGDQPARRLERRWAPRYSFRADLEIEWGSAVLRGSTRDISANGMFIEAPDTLWVGAGFTARLNLSQTVKLDCSVKRVEPGRGMGVAVAPSESESQKLYHDLLSSLSPSSN
jgi:PilZ domain